MQKLTRRGVLQAGGVVALGAVAGCSALLGTDPPEDQTYEQLHRTALYVDDGVDLSVPDDVPTVRATTNADLVVLPAETDVEPEQAVDWLADERAVAVLGDGAEGTWLEWARSDAYGDAFGRDGRSDAEPDPTLVVAVAVDTDVTTYRHSWADGPRDRDILRELDETMADAATLTPR